MPRSSTKFLLPNCCYGTICALRTSWTNKNPSRRFASCGYSQGERCNFFQWLDPKMCDRSLEVIPGLLKQIDRVELELEAAIEDRKKFEEENEKLKNKNQEIEIEVRRLRRRFRWVVITFVILWTIFYWS